MRHDYKSVVQWLGGFNTIEDYFDTSLTPRVKSYIDYLRPIVDKDVMLLLEFVLNYMVTITDKETNVIVPFNESMLENSRVLGDKYKIEKRKTRWKANRNKIWKTRDIIRLYNGIVGDYVDSALILFDVKASIKYSKKMASQSEKDWRELLDDGFKFLPCDGTHKMEEITDALISHGYFNQDSNNETQCPIHLAMEKTKFFVSIKTSAHLDQWSENYLYSTYGVTPSPAAIRTGIIGELRDIIKKMCDVDLYEVMSAVRGVIREKHGDEQILAEWSYWWIINDSPSSPTRDDELTNWYLHGKEMSKSIKTTIETVTKYAKYFKDYANPTKKMFSSSTWWLWLMVCKSLEDKKINVKDEQQWKQVVQEFVILWNKFYFDTTVMTITGDSGKISSRTFKDFIGGLTTGFYGWFDGNFKNSMVNTIVDKLHLIELDPKRAFNYEDRWNIINRDVKWQAGDELVRIKCNGKYDGEWYDSQTKDIEYIYVNKCDAFTRTDLYEVDHKDVPHSKGGKTNWEDGELTTSKYNNWKSNKMKKIGDK